MMSKAAQKLIALSLQSFVFFLKYSNLLRLSLNEFFFCLRMIHQ